MAVSSGIVRKRLISDLIGYDFDAVVALEITIGQVGGRRSSRTILKSQGIVTRISEPKCLETIDQHCQSRSMEREVIKRCSDRRSLRR